MAEQRQSIIPSIHPSIIPATAWTIQQKMPADQLSKRRVMK